MRFLSYTLGEDPATTAPPTLELMTEMGRLMQEATEVGVLVATGGLAPVAEGTKVRYTAGDFVVTDGPFTEAKELVGGWALMEVRDREEAIVWTKRFLAIADEGESTLRRVFGPDDLPPGVALGPVTAERSH
jgi:hypothetical protein